MIFPPPPAHPLSPAEILAQEQQRYHAFINLALFLSVFTGIEIVIIFIPLPYAVMMGVLVAVSVIKFLCVILWFMHLIYDPPLLFYLFIAGMVLAAGTMVALLRLMAPDRLDMEQYPNSQPPPPEAASAGSH